MTSRQLPETDVAWVRQWCADRVPKDALHQVRVVCEVAPRPLTIIECRGPWRGDLGPEWTRTPVARLHYTQADHAWTLYWRDSNLKFHHYDTLASSKSTADLLAEIDRDPPACSGVDLLTLGGTAAGRPSRDRAKATAHPRW